MKKHALTLTVVGLTAAFASAQTPPPTPPKPDFPPADKVVDTTAAGDSFNGGYFAALLQGKSEAECLLGGHNLASLVVGAPGAIIAKS